MGLLGSFDDAAVQHEKKISVKPRSLDVQVDQVIECTLKWVKDGARPYTIFAMQRSADIRLQNIVSSHEVIDGVCDWYDALVPRHANLGMVFSAILSLLIQKAYNLGQNNFAIPSLPYVSVGFLHGTSDNPLTLTFTNYAHGTGVQSTFVDFSFPEGGGNCGFSNRDSIVRFDGESHHVAGYSVRSDVIFNSPVSQCFGRRSADTHFFLNQGFDKTEKGSPMSLVGRSGKIKRVTYGAPLARNCEFHFLDPDNLEYLEHSTQTKCKFYIQSEDGHKLIRRQRLHGMLNRWWYGG